MGLSLPKSNLIFCKKCLDKWVHFRQNLDKQFVGVAYGTDKDAYEFIKEELKSRYNVKGLLEGRIGCAIGAHTGPGILGITFLNETTDKFDEYLQ